MANRCELSGCLNTQQCGMDLAQKKSSLVLVSLLIHRLQHIVSEVRVCDIREADVALPLIVPVWTSNRSTPNYNWNIHKVVHHGFHGLQNLLIYIVLRVFLAFHVCKHFEAVFDYFTSVPIG